MRCIAVVIFCVFCRRAAAKESFTNCPDLARYQYRNWTSEECNSYPPEGIANIKVPLFVKINIAITFGKDYAKILKMSGSSDLIYQYEIDKMNTCSKNKSHIFESLQMNRTYEIKWSVAAVMKDQKICQAPFQTLTAFTTPRGKLSAIPSKTVINVTYDTAIIIWDGSQLENYYYKIEWKPKECRSENWMNNTGWKRLGTKKLTLDLKEYPYSDVKVSYFFANETTRNFKTEDVTINIPSNYTGAPDNEITTDIICPNKRTCLARLENNCYKQNGPRVVMLYDLRPINNSLIQYAKHALKGLIESDDGINYALNLPPNLLSYTRYGLMFTPASVNNASNVKNARKITFLTDPSAPNVVTNVTFSSSHTAIIVNWKKPPDLPPTGVLESFIITWECKGKMSYKRQQIVIETKGSLYSERLDRLAENELYDIKIKAKNENVAETSDFQISVSTSYKPSYPEIQTFSNVSENSFMVNLSKPLDLKEDYFVVIQLWENIRKITKFERSKDKYKRDESFIEMEVPNLTSSTQYWVSAGACYKKDNCSDWSPKKSVWTDIAGPQFDNITLNIAKTSNVLFTINVPINEYEEYSGKWNKYVIGRICDGRRGRSLDETINMFRDNFNTTNAVQTPIYSESYSYFKKMDGGYVIIPVAKDLTELSFRPDNADSKMVFAIAVVIFNDDDTIKKVQVFDDSEAFMAMAYYGNETLYITIGICGVIITSFLIFLFVARRYRASKMSAAKGKKAKDKKKRKKELQTPPSSSGKNKKHPVIKILRDEDKVKAPGSPVKRVIFKDHPNNLEDSEGKKEEELYVNVDFRQDTAVKDYLLKYINSFPLVEKIFNNVPSLMQDLHITSSVHQENRRKNRYTNNLAYDETRVILPTSEEDPFSDYINASYIDSPFHQKCFIATQGPKEINLDTRYDFFRMIWFTQPSHIIMIANLIEKGKKKVAQYWPDDEEPVWFEDILVTLLSTVEKKNFLIRVLMLQHQGQEMQVTQYQFTTWPDHGIPTHTYRFSQLTQRILRESTATNPIVVHCSAGIGRTGTLILTLVVLSQLELGGYVDFHQALILLRKGRPRLIENAMQFYFAHKLVFDIVSSMEKNISVMDYQNELRVLSPVIKEEYEEIQRNRWFLKEYQFDFASNPLLVHLNRDQYVLPADTNLVYLAGVDFPETERYINAARVSSDDLEGYYFTAEHPMPHTVSNIWKLIYEYGISVVILVNVFDDVENYPSLVPKNEYEVIYGDLLVTVIQNFSQNDDVNSIVEASVTISNINEPSISHSCILIQILDWPYGAELPESSSGFIYAVNKIKNERGRPSLVSCGDGVTGCGLIVTLAMILEHIELYSHINIYKTALETISDRPEAIISEAQYNYLYDVTGYLVEAMNPEQQMPKECE